MQPRVDVHWPTQMLLPDKRLIHGMTRNISMGGVYLESPESLQVDLELMLEITAHYTSEFHVFRCKGKVVHKSLLSNNRGHGIGLSFTKLSDNDKSFIQGFLTRNG